MNITGAKWSREILSRVLIEAYDNGDLPINEALAAADGILGRHALDFYKLEGRGGFSASTDNLQRLQSFSGTNLVSLDRSQSFTPRLPPSIQDSPKANKETNGFNAVFQKETMRVEGEQKGTSAETTVVKHVRLLYADGSGQRRCRVCSIRIKSSGATVYWSLMRGGIWETGIFDQRCFVSLFSRALICGNWKCAMQAALGPRLHPGRVSGGRILSCLMCRAPFGNMLVWHLHVTIGVMQVIPIGRYAEVSMDYGVGLTQACMGMTSFSDAPAPNSGVTNVGEIRLMPDASTKHRLPWYNFFLCCPALLRVFVIGIW